MAASSGREAHCHATQRVCSALLRARQMPQTSRCSLSNRYYSIACPWRATPVQAAEGKTYGAYDYAKDTSASAYDKALQSAYEQWQASRKQQALQWRCPLRGGGWGSGANIARAWGAAAHANGLFSSGGSCSPHCAVFLAREQQSSFHTALTPQVLTPLEVERGYTHHTLPGPLAVPPADDQGQDGADLGRRARRSLLRLARHLPFLGRCDGLRLGAVAGGGSGLRGGCALGWSFWDGGRR